MVENTINQKLLLFKKDISSSLMKKAIIMLIKKIKPSKNTRIDFFKPSGS
tara:strand:+ start:228 stop:377 length:150 start_codon:yes stop_codon:yes gene_type:complete